MKLEYLIVQCGGLGSRMQHLTVNKPKCLIPIFGKPLILHLAEAFKANIIIIGCYKYNVLKYYLSLFETSKKRFNFVYSRGKGSCGGIKNAIKYIPYGKPFGIIWSDIFFRYKIKVPAKLDSYVGLTNENHCRWTFKHGKPVEEGGDDNGIFGFFIFKSKKEIKNVPSSGEFVKFLRDSNVKLRPYYLNGVYEVGTIDKYNKLAEENRFNTRFFNNIKIRGNIVTKIARYNEFENLIEKEVNWYKFVIGKKYTSIPKIISFKPLKMQFIDGKHPFNIQTTFQEKKMILNNIIDALFKLHAIESTDYDLQEDREVLINKTFSRLDNVKAVLPKQKLQINNQFVNISYKDLKGLIEKSFNKIAKPKDFRVIHGDPTFSNILMDTQKNVKFIDPRGYYGNKMIYGNALYDFAKLYYSCIGNYDQFNLKNFSLTLDLVQDKASLNISSNNYEEVGLDTFDERFSRSEIKSIKIMYALIWLALTGYVVEDYDSIVGAYLKGLLELKKAIKA